LTRRCHFDKQRKFDTIFGNTLSAKQPFRHKTTRRQRKKTAMVKNRTDCSTVLDYWYVDPVYVQHRRSRAAVPDWFVHCRVFGRQPDGRSTGHWLLCLCRVHDPCSDPAEHNDLRSWWFAVYGLCKSRYPIVHHRNDYGIGTDAYYLAILPKCLIYRGTTALIPVIHGANC